METNQWDHLLVNLAEKSFQSSENQIESWSYGCLRPVSVWHDICHVPGDKKPTWKVRFKLYPTNEVWKSSENYICMIFTFVVPRS